MAVDAARTDLAHQIHAHRVAAERKESAVPERQDAAIAPDEIEGERQDRVGEVFAEQHHRAGADMEKRVRRHQQIGDGHKNGEGGQQGEENAAAIVRHFEKAREDHCPTLIARRPGLSRRTDRAGASG